MYTANEIRSKVNIDQIWLERGILAIDRGQTADEMNSKQTIHDNGRGWNSADAKFGGYLANWIRTNRKNLPLGRRLSGRFVNEARQIMQKYAGQLARIANEAAEKAVA